MRAKAIEAHKLIQEAHTFMQAYWQGGDAEQLKLISEFEIRVVMHVHGKKCDSRKNFEGTRQIAEALWSDARAAMQANGIRLPRWHAIGNDKVEAGTQVQVGARLAEVSLTGEIDDNTIAHRGFVVDEQIVQTTPGTSAALADVHTIARFDGIDKVVLTHGAGKGTVEVVVSRAELLNNWKVYVEE